jgi:pimeloyl-ACP methyl ester carboxylesterase
VTDMYAVVSHPGPVEASILSELSPRFRVRRRPILSATLRCLETETETETESATETETETETESTTESESKSKSAAATESSAARPPIVLLHGRGHAATIWLPLLPALAERRRVVAVDLPGFGHSSSVPFETGSPEDGLRFFTDPIEALIREQGLTNAVFIGHSLGAFVAVELALRGSAAPEKLVLIGGMGLGPSMTYASRAFFSAGPERLAHALGPRFLNLVAPYPKTPLGERLAALEHELYAVRGGRSAPAAAFNALFPRFGPAFNRRDRLGAVRCPTLLLWGERDAVFPPSVAEAAAAAMPDATLRIEPLGHSPHLEDPARVLPALLDFLA